MKTWRLLALFFSDPFGSHLIDLTDMASTRAIDTTIEVITPENISFDYQLAGPFRRLPAYLIDFVARWCLIILILLPLYLSGIFLSFLNFNFFTATPLLVAASFLIYFVLSWFYGTLMETYFNGRTIGKWITGIRVIEVNGRPVSGRSALLRNLLRIADFAPMYAISNVSEGVPPIYMIPTGMVGLLTMTLTRRMQRLGDLAAGTMVVIDEKRWQLPVRSVEDPRIPALATYLPHDFRISRSMARTLAVYIERREKLSASRRKEIAGHLIQPILDRINFRPEIDPDLMMYTLYYHAFLRALPATGDPEEEVDLTSLRGFSPLRHSSDPRDAVRQGPDHNEQGPDHNEQGPDHNEQGSDHNEQDSGHKKQGLGHQEEGAS